MGVNERIVKAMSSLTGREAVMEPAPLKLRYPMPGVYPVELRFLVLTYELGDLARCLFRRLMLGEEEGVAYLADTKLAIADIITQCRVLCLELGFDREEIEELGLMHLEETSKELKLGQREA